MKTRCIILCDVDGSNDDDEVNDDGDDEDDEDKDDDAGGGDGGDGRSAGCWVLACWLFSLPFSLSLKTSSIGELVVFTHFHPIHDLVGAERNTEIQSMNNK